MNEEFKVIITAEINNLKTNLGKAKKEVEKFGKTKKVLKEFGAEAQRVGEACAKGLKVIAGAVLGATTALLGLSAATEEYRVNQAKLETAFSAAGGSAATATQTYNKLYRVLGEDDVAVEAAGHLAKLTTNQKELSEWTNICQGVYATFGDSLPIESLTEAANETAKTGEITGALADALNWAGINEDKFQKKLDACNKEAEREQLIRTTLNGLYSEAAEKYETNAAAILAQNEAQARLNAALGKVGAAMAPVNTAFANFAAQLLEKITPYIESFVEEHLPTLIEVLGKVVEAVGKALEWLSKNWGTISTVAPVILSIVGALAALNTIIRVVQGVITVFTMNPIVLAIGGVIAAITLCIIHWEKIKEVVGNAAKTMSNAAVEASKTTKSALENMKTAYESNGGGIKGVAAATMEGIKGIFGIGYTYLNTLTGGKLEEIKNNFEKRLKPLKTIASIALEGIKKSFKEKFENAKTIVSNALKAIGEFFKLSKWELPKIKLPHITITGEWGFNPVRVPSFGISWYERGGVFDKPTIFHYGNGQIGGLGENGAEAVVPLEKNTKWLDILADKLAAKQGQTPIVLQVDGRTFAETTISTPNNRASQTGNIGLNIY